MIGVRCVGFFLLMVENQKKDSKSAQSSAAELLPNLDGFREKPDTPDTNTKDGPFFNAFNGVG